MSILKKIVTAIRGGTRELGEAIIDAQSTRIFEQEIADAKESLKSAKHDLAHVMAKELQVNRTIDSLEKDIKKNEAFVIQALDKNEENLALEIADKVAQLEAEKQQEHNIQQSYSHHIEQLKKMMEKAERQLKDYERQLNMVKTTQSVQKATATITNNFNSADSNLLSAKQSLQRIKHRQQDFDDHNTAAQLLDDQLTGQSLTDKMKQAGIGQIETPAQAVLARIKSQKTLSET